MDVWRLCKQWAEMPTEPRDHASKEESPLTKITHEASHSISYLLKPSKPIAPAEETMPSKETTRTEAKVLIQPTQKATTDASAPQDPTITWSSLHFLSLYIIHSSMFWCLIFWDWMCYWWYITYRHHFCLNLAIFFYFLYLLTLMFFLKHVVSPIRFKLHVT